MKDMTRQWTVAGMSLVAWALSSGTVWAQYKAPADTRVTKGSAIIEIRELEGAGPRAKILTPSFQSNFQTGRIPLREWGRLAVVYDTAAEWTDELTFQFYALLREGASKEFTLFKGAVSYKDIPKGKRHQSEMFIRPVALSRYGEVVAVSVEVLYKGESVGTRTETVPRLGDLPDPKEWEKNPKITVREGYLLNRSETPFAMINYDDFDTVK